MRTFIFTDKLVKVNRTYGGQTREINVYRVVNNKPTWLVSGEYNTASTTGDFGEANTLLVNGGHIPKAWSVNHRGTYGYYVHNDKYQILRVS